MHLELQDGLVALTLILAVATMLAIAPALRVPYPILLVLGGLAIGVVPGMTTMGKRCFRDIGIRPFRSMHGT